MSKQTGFTLIEMLVSLAIFALIGASAYQVLASAALVSEREQKRTGSMHELDRALRIIERDLRQIVDRPVRSEFGSQHALSSSVDWPLDFTRTGNQNPLGLARSDLLRVSYSLREPEADAADDEDYNSEQREQTEQSLQLLRTLARMPDSVPVNEQLLLSAVTAFSVRFKDAKSNWHDNTWPPQESGQQLQQDDGNPDPTNPATNTKQPALPVAIEVILLTADTGELSRVISLR